MRSIGTDIVLVRAVLATLGRDTLQFLLGRGIGVPNLHEIGVAANGLVVEPTDNVLAHVARVEAMTMISQPPEPG